MTPLQQTSLDLKADFVREALDIAQTHLVWVGNHLEVARYDKAVDAFGKMVEAIKLAAAEMASMRDVLSADKATAAAAEEFRANRDSAAPKGRAAA